MLLELKSKWFILLTTFIVYVLFHISRKPLSIVKPILNRECSTEEMVIWKDVDCSWEPFNGADGNAALGNLEFIYLLSYTVGLVISGHIAENSKINQFLAAGMFLSGLVNCLFGFGYALSIHNYGYYAVVQCLSGIFQSTGWPSVMTLMSNWWGIKGRGFIFGLWGAHCCIGNILGSLISSYLVSDNWGIPFIYTGLFLCFYSVLILFTVYDSPNDTLNEEPKRISSLFTINSIVKTTKLPNVIPFGLILFTNKLVVITLLNWLPFFLTDRFADISLSMAASLSTLYDFGGLIGGFASGYLSDLKVVPNQEIGSSNQPVNMKNVIKQRTQACGIFIFFSIPCIAIYSYRTESPFGLSSLILFMCGFFSYGSCSLITTAIAADLGQQTNTKDGPITHSSVIAIIDAFGSFGGAIGPLITGHIVYDGWSRMFILLIVSNSIGFFLLCFVYSRMNSKFKMPI